MTDRPQVALEGPIPLNDGQIRLVFGAVLEVVSGAPAQRILELAENLVVGKQILRALVDGKVIVRGANAEPTPTTPVAPSPATPVAPSPEDPRP